MEKKTKATEAKKDAALKESFAEIKKAVAETAKAAEKKAAPAKEAVKEEAPKKEAAPKKTAPAKKTEEKKPAEKTAPAKAEVKTAVTLQIDGRDFDPAKIVADAQKAAEKIKKDVKDVHIYINVNDQAAYFTVDGEGKPEYRVNL